MSTKSIINDLGKKARSEKVLGKTGYNAAMKAIKGYMDEFINMDKQKASAYLATSMAGEMSDIAEGSHHGRYRSHCQGSRNDP